MKFGDTVIYTENGQEYTATVLGSRELEHHAGENGEPLLHLGFFKETSQPVFGTSRMNELVQWRPDVAHESHAFSNEARVATRNNLPEIHEGGRWRELGTEAHPLTPPELAKLARAPKPAEEPAPTPVNTPPAESIQ